MNKARVTPKDFFLWAGAMIALYWSVIAFVFLMFSYIDYTFPDALSYLPPNPYDSGIGGQMASIVVMFPIYAALIWVIRADIARDHSRAEIWVRRWALILTLFVAGVTIAGDLISLLATFFSGSELTTGFLMKSAILLLVAAGAFMHFIADFWGYWEKNEGKKRSVCYSVGFLAALTVFAGFYMFGSPSSARDYRYDEQRVSDLQNIQSQIITYWQAKQSLPTALSDLNDSISGWQAPSDPATKQPYEYRRVSTLDFELCTTFATAIPYNQSNANYPGVPIGPAGGNIANENWVHDAGHTCFDRSIDPQLYPPLTTKTVPASSR